MQPWDEITHNEATHPTSDQLASFFDPTLGPEVLEALAAHIDGCPECEIRLEQIEPTLSQYRLCLDDMHACIKRPSRKDAELWAEMERLEANRALRRSARWRFAWAGGLVAVLVAGVVLLFPAGRGSELRAEALLARAATVAAQSGSNYRLRVRTRTASFVRPAVRHSETAEETAVGERFVVAHYDWRDPLNPRSYSNWRNRLKRKTSKVSASRDERTGQLDQRIETRTQDGVLLDASLVLDANLAPVGASFQFADREWVEITAIPEVAPSPSPVVRQAPAEHREVNESAPSRSSFATRDLLERDLDVRLTIDALHASASEPIEVTPGPAGEINVIAYGLAPQRLKQLQASLEKIDGVKLRATDETTPIADQSDGLPRASQDVSFEAHYLAELANRFDSVVTMLSAVNRAKLLALQTSHAAQLMSDLQTLRQELEQEHFDFADSSPADPAPAETRALADGAAVVDRLITELYSGAAIDGDPAALRRDLAVDFARLERLADEYSRRLEQAQKDVR